MLPELLKISRAGRHVDEADRAQPEFGRQRTGDQRQAADQIGVQNAAEAADAVRQNNAVDTILHIGMIVADVERPLAAESCETPGNCNSTFSTGALVPSGSASIVSWLFVSDVVPIVV